MERCGRSMASEPGAPSHQIRSLGLMALMWSFLRGHLTSCQIVACKEHFPVAGLAFPITKILQKQRERMDAT